MLRDGEEARSRYGVTQRRKKIACLLEAREAHAMRLVSGKARLSHRLLAGEVGEGI